MPYRDLRYFLQRLREMGELAEITIEVDPKKEIGAVCRKALDVGGRNHNKALLFKSVKRAQGSLVANLLATRMRYSLAFDTTPEKIHEAWLNRTKKLVEPIMVETGPCKENILRGNEVDLFIMPVPVWNEKDSGPLISSACQITKDPDTGSRNVGLYRSQVHDSKTVGIAPLTSKHLGIHLQKAKEKGERLPVAFAIGVDPAIFASAVASPPIDVDEFAMAGAMRNSPVELVKCETIPLEVPATSEWVLEGEILPDEVMPEGPFGEFTGYYAGGVKERPMVRIKAITHRDDPIFQGTYNGRPLHESGIVAAIPQEAEIIRECPQPGLRRVYLTEGGGGVFNAIVSVKQSLTGDAKEIAIAVLETWPGKFIKTLIIVDEDIDPYDWVSVDWALATRFQPESDTDLIRKGVVMPYDPSLPVSYESGTKFYNSKLIIYATKPVGEPFSEIASADRDATEKVEKEWVKYAIG